ncbi:hypothetical protein C1J03_12510 [Sulfitobacter sp. SK012]|uniref:hypothetical protein n=1 Tax=Sulfitobacter sp. SK012 TaxID=1389005 RepID=UPI000E0BCC4A|nr:hypothetical protein [Sulfitobacter sp. SK012]AXI46773.1 hypothetical protein C1J03_12510 [Sulfitobacter sp. SK012]
MADEQAMSGNGQDLRIFELHLMARAEIALGETCIEAQSYYNELRGLAQRQHTRAWLEASIMLAAIAKIRPSKAISNMMKLRALHENSNTQAEFNVFETQIKDYLAPLILTNHGYREEIFATADHDAIWVQVDIHLRTLRRAGYEVFLNSGTLLGIVRDAQLIDHDDDVDLAIMLWANSAEEAAEEWTALRAKLIAHDLFEADVPGMPGIYKLRRAGTIEIDLFPAWLQDDRVFVYPHTSGGLAAEDVLPLQPCRLTGQALPAFPERMLAENYGPGWETPDPLFKFPWAAANKRFAPFLESLG